MRTRIGWSSGAAAAVWRTFDFSPPVATGLASEYPLQVQASLVAADGSTTTQAIAAATGSLQRRAPLQRRARAMTGCRLPAGFSTGFEMSGTATDLKQPRTGVARQAKDYQVEALTSGLVTFVHDSLQGNCSIAS